MGRAAPWLAVAVILGGAALRFHLLGADVRFHPDEAFFAAFARDAAVRGEWLLPGDLDKTPLSIYGQAAAMLLTGIQWDGAVWRLDVYRGEFAARLWSLYWSVLLIALTYRLARATGATNGRATAAAALMAVSPFGVAFSATAFTDTPMVALAVMAVLTGLCRRGAAAGGWLVLAYAAKQQGLLFVPLVVWLLWGAAPGRSRRLIDFSAACGLGAAVLIAWDVARPGPAVWALAAANNTPGAALVPLAELPARAWAWGRYLGRAFGVLGTAALVLGAVVGRHPLPRPVWPLIIFVGGYGLLHWLVPLNIYDRYLLPIVPLLAVWAAWALPPRWWAVVVLLAIPAAWAAATVYPAIGGDRGRHDGIVELANDLNRREFGAIVYDRWLGWELNYYLGGWSDKRRAYYPSPLAMVTDPALYVPDVAPRYLPVPDWENARPWTAALHLAGFDVCVGYDRPPFRVFVLLPRENTSATACTAPIRPPDDLPTPPQTPSASPGPPPTVR